MSVLTAPWPRYCGVFDGSGSVSGTITDASGNPAHRQVSLLDRATMARIRRVESASDGTYLCAELNTARECLRIVHDDDAGTLYNDIIDRVIAG